VKVGAYQSSLASLKLTKATNIPITMLPNKAPAEKIITYESIIPPFIRFLNQVPNVLLLGALKEFLLFPPSPLRGDGWGGGEDSCFMR
jgi:hypothetical protein